MLKLQLLAFVLCISIAHAESKPKYGPEASVLSVEHSYLQHNPAPDYWAISPYYTAQQDDASCSVASVTMVANAARVGMNLTSDDELVTQKGLLKKVGDDSWVKDISLGGRGVTLDQLKDFTEKSLKAYGIKNVTVEAVHAEMTDAGKAQLHKALVSNEKSAKDFMIINFIQGVYTGDAPAGHIAPIAAYDAKHAKVLVMDPDRQWYEPYWVSEETLLKGMATKDDVSGKNRGYLYIQLGN
jgi:hypothetical protein